jgi:hypothetical protein
MPIIVMLVLLFVGWHLAHKVMRNKSDEQKLLEARICVLEYEITQLKQVIHT